MGLTIYFSIQKSLKTIKGNGKGMVKLQFRALIEVLGKPKEHVEKSIQSYIEKLKTDEKFSIKSSVFMDAKEQEKTKLWATFAELEIETEKLDDIVYFCFDYMPSSVEILSPQELTFNSQSLSFTLNDLQAKLHQVDMVAKQVKMERDHMQKNSTLLLRNFILVLLSKNKLNIEQMSKFTGVESKKLGDFLDKLIDEEKVELEGDLYFSKLRSNSTNNKA